MIDPKIKELLRFDLDTPDEEVLITVRAMLSASVNPVGKLNTVLMGLLLKSFHSCHPQVKKLRKAIQNSILKTIQKKSLKKSPIWDA